MVQISECGNEPDEFVALVAAAVTDAGLEDDDILVLGCPGQFTTTGYRGMAYPRHNEIELGETDMDLGPRRALGNSDQHLPAVRVAVCVEYPEPIVAGLVRHEFEHARQFDTTQRDASFLFQRAIEVLQPAIDVPNSGRLYGLIPMERDANAAAALFLAARYGVEAIDILHAQRPDDANLLRRPAEPPDLSTIEERMRHFILHDGSVLAQSAIEAGDGDALFH